MPNTYKALYYRILIDNDLFDVLSIDRDTNVALKMAFEPFKGATLLRGNIAYIIELMDVTDDYAFGTLGRITDDSSRRLEQYRNRDTLKREVNVRHDYVRESFTYFYFDLKSLNALALYQKGLTSFDSIMNKYIREKMHKGIQLVRDQIDNWEKRLKQFKEVHTLEVAFPKNSRESSIALDPFDELAQIGPAVEKASLSLKIKKGVFNKNNIVSAFGELINHDGFEKLSLAGEREDMINETLNLIAMEYQRSVALHIDFDDTSEESRKEICNNMRELVNAVEK